MSNISDLKKLIEDVRDNVDLFGGKSGFMIEFNDRIEKIGDAICKERGIERESAEAKSLISRNVVLGEKSEKLFKELKKWLNTQGFEYEL